MKQMLPITASGAKVAYKIFGIDFIPKDKDCKVAQIKPLHRYTLDKDAAYNALFFTTNFIGLSRVDTFEPFAVGYFGSWGMSSIGTWLFEYATASNDIEEIIALMKDYDCQSAGIAIYNPKDLTENNFVIYPFQCEYDNQSVGLI